MALIPEHFFKAVVAIGKQVDSNIIWMGTGFLYRHTIKLQDGKPGYLTYLVTNKHVLLNHSAIVLRFENDAGTSSHFVVPLFKNEENMWSGHPDADVDVAIINLNTHLLHKTIGPVPVFMDPENTLGLTDEEAKNLCEGDGIFLLGFPMGMVDKIQNLPIVRGGTIARLKDCKAKRTKSFLVDCQTFPGNSGGPVIVRPEIVSLQNTKAIGHAHLIGIVAAYVPYQDVAVSRQTGRDKIIFEENSGLSIVYPVDRIRETVAFTLKSVKLPEANPEVASPNLKDTNEVSTDPTSERPRS